MRNGYFAVYKGKEYTSDASRKGEKIILRSDDIKDIEKGFESCEPFICRYGGKEERIVGIKEVEHSELEAYYRLRTFAYYKGYKFEVMGEKDDMILITSIGGDYRDWLNLGMERIDKFYCQKWIKKSEAEIVVEREDR